MAELNESVVLITYFCHKCKLDVDLITGDLTCNRCDSGFIEEITSLKDESRSKKEVNTKDNNNECSICLTSYEKTDIITKLICQHRFHEDCITLWFKEKANCPLCREDVEVPSVISLVNQVTKASIRSAVFEPEIRRVGCTRCTRDNLSQFSLDFWGAF